MTLVDGCGVLSVINSSVALVFNVSVVIMTVLSELSVVMSGVAVVVETCADVIAVDSYPAPITVIRRKKRIKRSM